jgi:hypothetical protein
MAFHSQCPLKERQSSGRGEEDGGDDDEDCDAAHGPK